MSARRARAVIAAAAALGGVGIPGARARLRCPSCQRGKIVKSKTGAQYCHRCGWFERKTKP